MLVFGGSNAEGAATSSLYCLDLGTAASRGWTTLDCKGDLPGPR